MVGHALLARGDTKKKSIVMRFATLHLPVDPSPTLPPQEGGEGLGKIVARRNGKKFPTLNISRCGPSDISGKLQ